MDVASSNYTLEVDWQVNKCGSWLLSLKGFLEFKLDSKLDAVLKYKENEADFNTDISEFWLNLKYIKKLSKKFKIQISFQFFFVNFSKFYSLKHYLLLYIQSSASLEFKITKLTCLR